MDCSVNEFAQRQMADWGLSFRLAKESEKPGILAMYTEQLDSPFCTWNEYYPSEETIDYDFDHEDLFVLVKEGNENSELIGAISIDAENELEGYNFWTESGVSGEFSRVCIAKAWQGQGLAKVLVAEVEKELVRRGCEIARLLVAKVNPPAQKTYAACGYRTKGECFIYGNDYYAQEKRLS